MNLLRFSICAALGGAAALLGSPAAFGQATITIPSCTSPTLQQTASGSWTLDCSVTTPPSSAGAPGSCSVSASPSSLPSSGGQVSLTVSCSQGTTPFSYSWSRSPAGATGSGQTLVDSVPANSGSSTVSYTYTATVSNGAGSAQATRSISVAGVTAPPPSGGACEYSPRINEVLPALGGQKEIYGNVPNGSVVVMSFTTGGTPTPSGLKAGKISAAEHRSGGGSPRIVWISKAPCGVPLDGNAVSYGFGGSVDYRPASIAEVSYSIETPLTGWNRWAVLQANSTYYVNIMAATFVTSSRQVVPACNSSDCGWLIAHSSP